MNEPGIVGLIAPLVLAVTEPDDMLTLLADLGVPVDAAPDDPIDDLRSLLPIDAIEGIVDVIQPWLDGSAEGSLTAGDLATIVESVSEILASITELADATAASISGDLPDWLDAPALLDAVARLPGYLLRRWFDDVSDPLGATVDLLGLTAPIPGSGVPWLDAARLGRFLGDPAAHLHDEYVAGGEILGSLLVDRVLALGRALDLGAVADDVDVSGVVMLPPGDRGAGALEVIVNAVPDGLLASVAITGVPRLDVDLGNGWSISSPSDLDALAGAAMRLDAGGLHDASTAPSASTLEVAVSYQPPAPAVLLGSSPGSRVVLGGASATIGTTFGPRPTAWLKVDFPAERGLSLVIEAGDADSFLGALLANVGLSLPFPLEITADSAEGIHVGSGAGLAIRLPLDLRIGPVTIGDLLLELLIDGALVRATAAAAIDATIGPIAVAVDGIGLAVDVDVSGQQPPALAFKPPEGLGIGVDLGVVAGGGYLFIDAEAGSYDGVLDLEVLGVGISAVAIIDTKLPDVDGWSMFFALFLDLPSVQLGFGFTLTGVGGVAGINRAIDADALGAAVRAGSLDTILFPPDPIADAPIIIEEFRAIFPPANDSYVFGPIVRIGWGTPTLIEARLGIVIQLPDPLVIVVLGSISAVLPNPDVELIALRLDVAGVIDFDAGTLAIDASLHDSHVVGFALAGDMALRAEFGNAQAFLMSVGGFHPRFDPPGDFPTLRRVTFGISAGSVLRIDFQSYFALTSNSVQCGATFTLDADVMGFGVFGSAGFDALIQFSPFMVITSLQFEVSITAAGIDLMGVQLTASVEGPNRWHVIGTARFEVLGIGKDIRVDELIGPKESEPAVEPADVLDDLVAALESDEAWQVIEAADRAVTLRDVDDPAAPLMATPDSVIEVRQTVVPLGIAIEQYGNAPVGEHASFDLEALVLDPSGTLDDWFAPGRFFELTKDEKLEGPEFELMRSGIRFGGGAPVAGASVAVDTGYKAYVIDPEFEEADTELAHPLVANAQGVSLHAQTGSVFTVVHADPVGTSAPIYAVVDDGGVVVERTTTWAAAYSQLDGRSELHIERDLEGAGR